MAVLPDWSAHTSGLLFYQAVLRRRSLSAKIAWHFVEWSFCALSMALWQKTWEFCSDCVNFDLNCPQIDSADRGGSHSSSHSSPPRKHATNTEGKGPTGTNDSMASGGQGAQTTPKVQTAQRKTNQHRKKETKGGKDPNKPSQTQRGSPRRQGNPKECASGQDQ